MSGEVQAVPPHYFVLSDGQTFGPFSEDELHVGLKEGRFKTRDFIQAEGLMDWHPLGQVLGLDEGDVHAAVAPDWACILKWAWARMRYCSIEQSLAFGGICLGIGAVTLVLSHWPFVFWVPWFIAAAAAGIVLIRNKRRGLGMLLLAGVVALPLLFHVFWPKARVVKSRAFGGLAGVERSSILAPPPLPESLPAPTVRDSASDSASIPGLASSAPAATSEAHLPESAHSSLATASSSRVTAPEPSASAPVQLASTAPIAAPPARPVTAARPIAPPVQLSASDSVPGISTAAPPTAVASNSSFAISSFVAGTQSTANKVGSFFYGLFHRAKPPEVIDPIQAHHDALVVVSGSNGSGSGFICQANNRTWLFTNIHVVAELKEAGVDSLDGTAIVPGAGEVAAGADIARFALSSAPPHPFEAITDLDREVHIGDDVLVAGNSGGGGVVTSLQGKVLGIGPDRLEVSAEFIPGNSGSPIIHVPTGKVIGIATYLTRRYEEFSSNPVGGQSAGNKAGVVVRRFGYRIDNVQKWEAINWPEFYGEADSIQKIDAMTKDLISFLRALRSNSPAQYTTDAVHSLAEEYASRIQSARNQIDRRSAAESFLNGLRFLAHGDVQSARGRVRYTYFRNELDEQLKWRDKIYDAYGQIVSGASTNQLSRPAYQ